MQFKRIDIHAHANFPEFDGDRAAVMRRALDGGTAMMNVGTDLASSQAAVALADQYGAGVYAVVGMHPTETGEAFDASAFRPLAMRAKTVAIGECGLDYFRLDEGTKEAQKRSFIAQIELANDVGKPLMLHLRDAYDDAIDILKAHARVKGNSHFFAGTVDQARRLLDIGYTMSFTGVITFAREYRELVEFVPLDMMHAETDCPFVAPAPHRGGRNEPSFVSEVVAKIAEYKKRAVEEVERALVANAERLFSVSLS